MYVLLDEYLRVKEFIPEFDEKLPGIPISKRFPPELVESLIYVEDGTNIAEGYKFNEETGIWEYLEVVDVIANDYKVTLDSRVSALEKENKLLKEQNEALSAQMDFYEECIIEMAEIIYA